jgi:hypothetical protein
MLVVRVGVLALGFAGTVRVAVADPPLKEADIEAMRAKVPYVSLADRLAYERLLGERSTPSLSKEAEAMLDEMDAPGKIADTPHAGTARVDGGLRGESIRLLHSETVADFIKREGFGITRHLQPSPAWITMKDPEVSPAEALPPLSANHTLERPLPIVADGTGDALARLYLPTRAGLLEFVSESNFDFASAQSFGHVESIERVAGLEPHAFRHPIQDRMNFTFANGHDESKHISYTIDTWRIVRLELVSLLKHETPAVYLSEHLPRMDELSETKTRRLTAYEMQAIESFRAGEQLMAQTTGNVIEMVGAIRAAKQCMACHEVPRGTLLGAFTYQLQRHPPIDVSQPAAD